MRVEKKIPEKIPTDRWDALRPGMRQRWSKVSEDELKGTKGNKEQIASLLEREYRYSKKEAHKQLEDFVAEEEARRKLGSDLIEDVDAIHE